MLTVGDLFSGIGGFTLGLEMCGGFETKFFVEIDPFCQKVLRKNFPGVPIYDDITKIQWVVANTERMRCGRGANHSEEQWDWILSGESTGGQVEGQTERRIVECGRIDLLTGGFPCQPFSCAGKRKGSEDSRFLWPQMLRAICEIKPRWVLAENVPGLLTLQDGMVFEGMCIDLENEGYEVIPLVIPACSQSAPHRRDRIFFVAHNPMRKRHGEDNSVPARRDSTISPDRHASDTTGKVMETSGGRRSTGELVFREKRWQEHWYEVATRLCRVDDGVSNRVDRLKCLGNAVIPQIVCQIGKAMLEVECDLPGGHEPFPEKTGKEEI